MAHQPKGAHWRDLGKGHSADSADKSTNAILKSLRMPRGPGVVTTHAGVASVGATGAKPTMPKTNDGNTAINKAFNDTATKGPKMRLNVVMIPGR